MFFVLIFCCFGHLDKQTNSLLMKIFPRLLTPATYLHELCNCNFVCNFIVSIFSDFFRMERWNLLLEILCIVKMIYFLIFSLCICQNTQSQRYYSEILSNPVKLMHWTFQCQRILPVFLFFKYLFNVLSPSLIYFKSLKIPINGMDYRWTKIWSF